MPKTKTPYALLLRTDETFQVLDWPASEHLKALYQAIDCQTVAAVDLTAKLTMWLDDEGIINGAPFNVAATRLYGMYRPLHQRYYGTAVLTGGPDRHGDTRGLTEDQLCELIERHLSGGATVPVQRTR
ncbi:DUF3846 domain-containing protein [Streptomyces sp. enrichment culture]|uniref:DUF3846 domain-containing protein n=1 Tax=Streptomyces sp. enrichment culture TaxID=1795815 RepID=UPI003F54B708